MNIKLITATIFLGALISCNNTAEQKQEVSSSNSEPGLSLGIATVPNLRDLGGYKTIDEATQVATSVFADMKESEFTGHIKKIEITIPEK